MKRYEDEELYDTSTTYGCVRDRLLSESNQYSKGQLEALNIIIEEAYLNDEEFNQAYFDAAVDHLCTVYGRSEASLVHGSTRLDSFTADEKKIHGTEVKLRAFKEETKRLVSLLKDDLEYNRMLNLDYLKLLYQLVGLENNGWENISQENYGA